jgi:hypothetical protein
VEVIMKLRSIAGACCLAAVASVGAVQVGAQGGPLIFRETVDDTFVAGFCGFPLEVHSTGTAVFHVFFDASGAFERVLITAPQVQVAFTNLETGASVWTPSVNMVRETANEDGTFVVTLRGLFWHLIVPGQGLVTADVGRIDLLMSPGGGSSEVVFEAGQQDGEFLQTLCSVLGA